MASGYRFALLGPVRAWRGGKVVEQEVDAFAGDAQKGIELLLLAILQQLCGRESKTIAVQHPVNDVIAAEPPAILGDGLSQ